MTPCAPSSPPEAVFSALALGARLGERVIAAVRSVLATGDEGDEQGPWRFARPEGLHVTLFYAGRLEPKERSAYGSALRAEFDGLPAPRLVLRGTGAFPARGAPRVLFVALDPHAGREELRALAERARWAAERAGVAAQALRRSQGRPFRPHVTVARPRRRGACRRVPQGFGDLELELAFEPDEAVLMRSVRGEGPARYPLLERYPLVTSGRE